MNTHFCTNKFFQQNTIHPDPSLWRYTSDPVIVNQCAAIADYPHIARSYARKDELIDYLVIEKYESLFDVYENDLVDRYLDENSPLFLTPLFEKRYGDGGVLTDDFKQFIQFIYELQCAVTEFYVYVTRFHFQFRKTLLPLLDETTAQQVPPFLYKELLASHGYSKAYTAAYAADRAQVLAKVYDVYLRLTFGLKIALHYLVSQDLSVVSQDVEITWLANGFINAKYEPHISALAEKSKSISPIFSDFKLHFFQHLQVNFYSALNTIGGAFSRESMDGNGNSASYNLKALFKKNPGYLSELTDTYQNAFFSSHVMNGNAAVKLSNDLLNQSLLDDQVLSFEISVFSGYVDHSHFLPELLIFGGIYNPSRNCVCYPFVMHDTMQTFIDHDEVDKLYADYITSFIRNLLMNYKHILYVNTSECFENQAKKRLQAQAYN